MRNFQRTFGVIGEDALGQPVEFQVQACDKYEALREALRLKPDHKIIDVVEARPG